MSALFTPLRSPPSRPPPEGRAHTRSAGPASRTCEICSPPSRPLRVDGHLEPVDDPSALVVEAWCSPTLVSPAGRPCSVLELAEHQAAVPANIADPYLNDDQWDKEAMVLCTIAGQLEDEQEETMLCDPEEEELQREECDSPHAAFSGWALGHRGAAPEVDSSCQLACCTHASTPDADTSSAVVPTTTLSSARLPSSGTAEQRAEGHWKMASKDGHSAFACGCALAKARGAQSCLDRFGKEQFRRWHNETYGVTADGKASKDSDPATHIHRKMWELKEPIAFKANANSAAQSSKELPIPLSCAEGRTASAWSTTVVVFVRSIGFTSMSNTPSAPSKLAAGLRPGCACASTNRPNRRSAGTNAKRAAACREPSGRMSAERSASSHPTTSRMQSRQATTGGKTGIPVGEPCRTLVEKRTRTDSMVKKYRRIDLVGIFTDQIDLTVFFHHRTGVRRIF